MGINRFRLLARMLSRLQGERYRGAVIMRAGWRREASLPEGEGTPAILQDRHGMMKICCRSGHEELMVTLLLGRGADCRATDAESSVFGGEDKDRYAFRHRPFVHLRCRLAIRTKYIRERILLFRD